MIPGLTVNFADRSETSERRNIWIIGVAVLLVLGVVAYVGRWKLLALIASLCGYFLQADVPRIPKSLAGRGLREYGRIINS
jgi:hypothetical protein